MDLKNTQSANRKEKKDISDESTNEFEKEDPEKLKRLGRQAED